MGEHYVWAGNDLSRDGGLDCSGAVLCGLRDMGYDVPDMTADGIYERLTVPADDEGLAGKLRFLFDELGDADHVQTLGFYGRVNATGGPNNDREDPGIIEYIPGAPPDSGEIRELDWETIEEAYGDG